MFQSVIIRKEIQMEELKIYLDKDIDTNHIMNKKVAVIVNLFGEIKNKYFTK